MSHPALLRQQAYIDGRWTDARDGQTQPIRNPSNGARIGAVPVMGAQETRQAIEAAEQALGPWRARPCCATGST